MNKQAQIGTALMHLYAAAALVIVIVFFVIIFNVAQGSVASASTEGGDLYAEQLLATIMKYSYDFNGESLTIQQAVNRQSTREDALKTLANALEQEMKKGDKIGYYAVYNEDRLVWDGLSPSATYSIDGYSTACWPYKDQNEIKFVKVYVGDQLNLGYFRGELSC